MFLIRPEYKNHKVILTRETLSHSVKSIEESILFDIEFNFVDVPKEMPTVFGWEKNSRNKYGPKMTDLKGDLDPEK